MKFLTIIILFVFSYTHSHNEFVTIKFQNLEYLESGWKGKEFHFKINGIVIQPDTTQHEIPIIKKKLDVIFFSMDGKFNKNNMTFTKFRKNETYIIKINPCSQYELLPEVNPQKGSVTFISKEESENFELKFCVESILFNKLNSKKTTKCLESGLCPFSKKEISIINNDEKIDSFYFHFLHGENLLLKFSNKKLKFKIKN